MGKAIEGTWTVYNGRFVVDIAQEDSDDAWWAEFDSKNTTAEDDAVARAKLAAAAPEMARMLLNEEWTSQESDEGHLPDQCLRCFGHRNGYVDPGHKPGCEWVALMKKAGVLK